MFYLYLTAKHVDESGAESTAVQVSVDYYKGSGVMLNLTGVEHDKGEPDGAFRYMPIGSPKASHLWEKFTRSPGKKMAGIEAIIKNQIDTKSGPAYDHLTAFLTKYGMQVS